MTSQPFEEFPADLQQFIAEHITSVAHVEILLFLKQEEGKSCSIEQICSALRTPDTLVAEQLLNLQASQLAQAVDGESEQHPPRYRYHAGTPELNSLVKRLGDAYAQRRVSVITFIYSRPVDKVRTFADAFRLRQEE